jgi:capsular exopolysaccharide synthesis family protein
MAEYNPGDFNNDHGSARPANGNAANGSAPTNYAGPSRNPGMPNQPGMPNMGGHLQAGSSHGMDTSADGLVHILSRQWYVVVLTTIAVLMAAVLYLLVTKPTYTSVSQLRVTPLDPASVSSSTASNPEQQADNDFLETECITINSNSVVALAMDKIRDTRTLKGVAHPMEYVRARLVAEPSKKGRAIDVSFDSHDKDDANLIVDSVVDAYKDYESQAWKSRADEFLETLKSGSKGQEDELVRTEQRLHDLALANGFRPDMDPDKTPQHDAVLNLREAKDKASLETIRAHNAYQEAAKSIIGNQELVRRVDEEEQHAGYSANPEDQLKRFQDELALEQAKLVDDSRLYLPNHPTVRTDEDRVNAMIVKSVVAAKEWEESTQNEQEAIEKQLAVAEKAEFDIADSQKQYIQLRADADRLRKMSADVDTRAHEIDLSKGAGALNIAVLNPAEITGEPKPARVRTLAIGMVVGLIAGLGFACVRDWTDDRMRTPQAIRATVGVPVLGAIPAITTAYTAADRGQIVHHEPFGDAAESYRTLRTALQFGLPAGVKTLLVTSPVSGDGKSTFVSNIGIAMAQASKRVLIIDADFRAPMQHRLFGLKDRVGLASVLGGGDTIDQAIQRTEIEGLDVLPCGPTPSNPAEMLNSPAFNEHLQDLADKYDLILLDSPPVTAVADARILAASADVSLMVIRLDRSTRKQAEAARDGLRSVGARLIGVAVNGVTRAGSFGGASGYYQSSGTLSTGLQRAGASAEFGQLDRLKDPTGSAPRA